MNREVFSNVDKFEPVSLIRKITREILKRDGNVVRLSLASLFCALSFILVVVLCAFPTAIFTEEEMLSGTAAYDVVASVCGLALLIGLVFLFLPTVTGFIYFVKLTVEGKRPALIELLAPFRSGRLYFRSIMIPIVVFLRMLMIILPLVGGVMSALRGIGSLPFLESVADVAFVLCLTAVATVAGAYLSSYFFFVPYLMISRDKGFLRAVVASVRASSGRRMQITRLIASHTVDVVLSIASFMVLWVTLGAPRTSVSYFVYCNGVFDNFEE